jgi:hypothetical protein
MSQAVETDKNIPSNNSNGFPTPRVSVSSHASHTSQDAVDPYDVFSAFARRSSINVRS